MPRAQSDSRRQRRYDRLAILAYVASYQQQHQRSPSQRRIQRDLGVSAPSVVHMILGRLERAGLLRITRQGQGRTSALTLTEAGRAALQQWQQRTDDKPPR